MCQDRQSLVRLDGVHPHHIFLHNIRFLSICQEKYALYVNIFCDLPLLRHSGLDPESLQLVRNVCRRQVARDSGSSPE